MLPSSSASTSSNVRGDTFNTILAPFRVEVSSVVISAPASLYAWSEWKEVSPAADWTLNCRPLSINSLTVLGVAATRFSPWIFSFKMAAIF